MKILVGVNSGDLSESIDACEMSEKAKLQLEECNIPLSFFT